MPTPRKPQDHKPKVITNGELFSFEHEGVTYHLPGGETVADKLPGRLLRDAIMEGEDGGLKLGFAMLERIDADPGALDALYAMTAGPMMEIVQAWMEFKPSEDEPSLGESSRSSS